MQGSFWNAVFTAREAVAMAHKYAWLRTTVLEAAGTASAAALRQAAGRWPGSLRECQRVAPARYREREHWAQEGAAAADCAHAAWLARGRAAVVLWSELHRLIGDVLTWRAAALARGAAATPKDAAAFLRDLTLRDPGRRAAWPDAASCGDVGGVGLGLAEACLAHRAGWDRTRLRACLLDLGPS
jgi:hypothetical protein